MNPVMLIIEYQPSDVQKALPVEQWREQARQIGGIDGLRWKYWLDNRRSGTRGGVYLFDDQESTDAGKTVLTQGLVQAGATSIVSKTFDVDGDLSSITRGAL